MAESQPPLIVLDYDGVVKTRKQSNRAYISTIADLFLAPIKEMLETGEFSISPALETLSDADVDLILIDVRKNNYLFAINGILLKCDCPKEARKAAQASINKLLEQNPFPPLPEPDIDVESVLALKNLEYRVSLLTIQSNPDFQLPKSLQGVFEQVMIAPAPAYFGDNSGPIKIHLYREHYPDEEPLFYLGDQPSDAEVAQGIGATYFFQVTGDLPRYELERIRADTPTVETLADFVRQLSNSGLGRDLENA